MIRAKMVVWDQEEGITERETPLYGGHSCSNDIPEPVIELYLSDSEDGSARQGSIHVYVSDIIRELKKAKFI